MESPQHVKELLKTEAQNLGFVLFGCARPGNLPAHEAYQAWLKEGGHAGMEYLARPQALLARADPALLLPGIKTLICLAMPYRLLPSPAQEDSGNEGIIATYACFEDYHTHIKEKLGRLAGTLATLSPEAKYRVCVDADPILEKAYAQQAGLGWIGENTLLFNKQFGSQLLLAELLTTLELPPDAPLQDDPCAQCGRCIKACPTGALTGKHSMKASCCLSFLTIENRGNIPTEFRPSLGNRVFGCDACQTACPYNEAASTKPFDTPLRQMLNPHVNLHEELLLDEKTFKAKYADTPVLRAKHKGYLRNIIIAAANAGQSHFLPSLCALQKQATDSILQEMLAWAIEKLSKANQAPLPR
ncbi:MAG: tRNA epoxyqueuosine(34) reductase QueG [Anaerolineaceae bacterium]|nr:tRNA epoxyqueuosine(34) reductase QueG [Anaerolineaceae bacterium]